MDYMERMTYAQAVGEAPPSPLVFIPGQDFDPGDEDDREAVRLAGEIDKADRERELRRQVRDLETNLAVLVEENDELRKRLGE